MGVSVNGISDYYSKLNLYRQENFTGGRNSGTNAKIDSEANGKISGNTVGKTSGKTNRKIDPESAGAVVRAHEHEHVSREVAKVQMNGGKVTKADNDNRNRKDFFLTNYNDLIAQNFGMFFDVRV